MKRTMHVLHQSLGATLLCIFLPTVSSLAELRSPEYELKRALNDLDNIHNALTTSNKIQTTKVIGPRLVSAERSFEAAKKYFRASEPLSVVRELNNYLNQVQVPETDDYLESLYMLARSYQQLEMEQRAVRAYRRYLTTYLSGKGQNSARLMGVLKHMLSLAVKQSSQTRDEINQLLSAVTSIKLVEKDADELMYLAAQAAADIGRRDMASEWFSLAAQHSKDPELKARALYYQALLQITRQEFASAQETLNEILATEKLGSEMLGLANLALGRTNIHLRRPEAAVQHYQAVATDLPIYREAMFELTYIFIEINEDAKAQETAKAVLQRFPDSLEATQLRHLIAYIQLRSGDLDAASQSIMTAQSELAGIDRWLAENLQNERLVTYQRIRQLADKTEKTLERSPLTSTAHDIFRRAAEVQTALIDIRSEIRDTLYTIGRANTHHYNPSWEKRADQFEDLTKRLLEVGHRVSATEMAVHKDSLSAVDQQKLSASEKRRTQLFTPAAMMRRQLPMWSSWINLTLLSDDISRLIVRSQMQQAELAALGFLDARSNQQGTRANLNSLVQRQLENHRNLERSLEIVRHQQVLNMASRGRHVAVQNGFIQYANALYEEATVMARYRDQEHDTSLRAISMDVDQVWKRWEYVARASHLYLEEFVSEIKTDLKQTVETIQSLIDRHDQLVAQTKAIQSGMEEHLGDSVFALVGHYRSEIDKRLSSQRKWQADIEWLRLNKANDEAKNSLEKITLEKQILRDSLDDMVQGVPLQ